MALFFSLGADLPDVVPIPEPRPDRSAPADQAQEPVKKPEKVTPKENETKPTDDHGKVEDEQVKPEEKVETYVPPPIETEDPAKFQACLTALKQAGVVYREVPRVDDGNGCGIDRPIVVSSVASGIMLRPEGEIRCEEALALSKWTSEIVIPMLKTAKPDETLIGLNQASAYVCRKRDSAETGKISEHAHGNAIDIAGLSFKSGHSFSIQPRMHDSTLDGAFQRAITSAACLYFTTVLDPSSDKAHETHLHLDVIARRAGFRYCW
jgi:hypothetical protein